MNDSTARGYSGQQCRRWTPVGSWTVSADPTHMAEAVARYAEEGYTWMKYHLSVRHLEATYIFCTAVQRCLCVAGGF